MLCLLLPAFAALPDLVSMYFYRHFWPSDADIIMEEEVLSKRKSRQEAKTRLHQGNVGGLTDGLEMQTVQQAQQA
jgi:hypothetical protein